MKNIRTRKNFPLPGLRTLKTAVAAVLCIALYALLGRDGVILAILSVFICMQSSVNKSMRVGFDRLVGTLLGGVFAVLVGLFYAPAIPLWLFALSIGVGIVLLIYICCLLNMHESIIIGLVTFVVIAFELRTSGEAPFLHAGNRTLDTVIGAFLAILINFSLFRPKEEKDVEKGSRNQKTPKKNGGKKRKKRK